MSRSQSMQLNLPPVLANPVVPHHEPQDNALVRMRLLLRDAIDGSGWKHDAVASALGVDAPYLSKMLAGEKTITLRHLAALPDDVKARFASSAAERLGFIVVKPVQGPEAIKGLVSGLVGLLMKGAA